MDPNAALESLRQLTQEVLEAYYSAVNPLNYDPAGELAETIDNLDEWLSKGGFLPDAWQR